jgi:mannose/fructose/N-acetylgalactosamine-specific phosphotransferase system component IID
VVSACRAGNVVGKDLLFILFNLVRSMTAVVQVRQAHRAQGIETNHDMTASSTSVVAVVVVVVVVGAGACTSTTETIH